MQSRTQNHSKSYRDDSNIIKQADKGVTIVILDKEHYKKISRLTAQRYSFL